MLTTSPKTIPSDCALPEYASVHALRPFFSFRLPRSPFPISLRRYLSLTSRHYFHLFALSRQYRCPQHRPLPHPFLLPKPSTRQTRIFIGSPQSCFPWHRMEHQRPLCLTKDTARVLEMLITHSAFANLSQTTLAFIHSSMSEIRYPMPPALARSSGSESGAGHSDILPPLVFQ